MKTILLNEAQTWHIMQRVKSIPEFIEQFHILVDAQPGDTVESLLMEMLQLPQRIKYIKEKTMIVGNNIVFNHDIDRTMIHKNINEKKTFEIAFSVFVGRRLITVVPMKDDILKTRLTSIDDRFVLAIFMDIEKEFITITKEN